MKHMSKRNRILLSAILIVVIIIVVILIIRAISPFHSEEQPEVIETRQRLKDMEARDISAIQDEIDDKRILLQNPVSTLNWETDIPAVDEAKEYNYKEIFSDCIVMGDSNTERLLVFDYLNSSQVIADTGMSMVFADEHLQQASNMSPRIVFLSYGLNDISHTGYGFDTFREYFEDFLTKAEAALPNTMIYVNLIFPVTSPLSDDHPWYTEMDTFNDIIKEVCEEHGVPWLDQTGLVKEEYYESDGYHFKEEFYPLWLYAMAKEVGLI